MFYHVKDLQFNARVSQPDPRFARVLLEAFGGANGELKSALQYFVQAFSCHNPFPDKYDMLMDIATEEFGHLEIVGATIQMLLGNVGGEMKDVLESVDVLTRDLRRETLPVEQIGLSYRHSGLAERGDIVLGVRFRLGQGDPQAIQARMAELAEQRREKQPLQYPSAGSTFKRPEGYFAGKLIQDAGLKGKTIGGAQVSEKHAGFLINTGSATAGEMLELIAFCQRTVEEKFGVRLETEVRIVGEE